MSVYVCRYMYACICMYVYVCVYVCVYMYACMYVYVCMHTCICMYAWGNCPGGDCPTPRIRLCAFSMRHLLDGDSRRTHAHTHTRTHIHAHTTSGVDEWTFSN